MKITPITVAVILSAGLFSAELGTIKNISHGAHGHVPSESAGA